MGAAVASGPCNKSRVCTSFVRHDQPYTWLRRNGDEPLRDIFSSYTLGSFLKVVFLLKSLSAIKKIIGLYLWLLRIWRISTRCRIVGTTVMRIVLVTCGLRFSHRRLDYPSSSIVTYCCTNFLNTSADVLYSIYATDAPVFPPEQRTTHVGAGEIKFPETFYNRTNDLFVVTLICYRFVTGRFQGTAEELPPRQTHGLSRRCHRPCANRPTFRWVQENFLPILLTSVQAYIWAQSN